ncbi:MAG: hypothetical protein HQ591_01700 [candidate division Zixibacteria bacterium]|nr:hypothetical protein [Candidatus Tariuqbacter arcticus]
MTRIIHHTRTLVYYDGPELFEASDQLGTKYLCLAVEDTEAGVRYLCVPVSNIRLSEFYHDAIDLRNIFKNPESEELFYTDIIDGDFNKLRLIPQPIQDLSQDWLPDSGFYLERPTIDEDTIAQESASRNRAIIHLALNPPEAREEPTIYRSIPQKYANPLYELANMRDELKIEEVSLIGRVISGVCDSGAWKLRSEEDGNEYSGVCDPESTVSLNGITLKTKLYKFVCKEKIEEFILSGKEKKKLLLISIEEA